MASAVPRNASTARVSAILFPIWDKALRMGLLLFRLICGLSVIPWCPPRKRRGRMGDHNVEQEIENLDPEVSKVYFDAKRELINSQNSRTERFARAAKIVRMFWKMLSR